MTFKTHIICTCLHPPSTGGYCICIWFFQQLHSAIEQNKQKCLFHFPVLEKRPYFPYSLTQIRFAFYFGTTPFIANLLSGGIVDQLRSEGPKKLFLRPPRSYLRVWTPTPPPPIIWRSGSPLLLILLWDSYPRKTLCSDARLWNCPWGCAARFSKSRPYFRPKDVIFHTCFQTRPLKSLPVFRPGGGRSQNTTT